MRGFLAVLVVFLVGFPILPSTGGEDGTAGRQEQPAHRGSVTVSDLSALTASHVRLKRGGEAVLDTLPAYMAKRTLVHSGARDFGAPVVAAQSNDNFILAWMDIHAQVVDRGGDPIGEPIVVKNLTGDMWYPSVAVQSDDSFIIAWADDRLAGDLNIYAQGFDRNGTRLGGEIEVCTAPDLQSTPRVAVYSNDSFVVVWEDYRSGTGDICARRFHPDGTGMGDEVTIIAAPRRQNAPDIAINSNDQLMAVWQDNGGHTAMEVRGQLLDSDLRFIDGQLAISGGNWDVWSPTIAADPWGNFIVAWEDLRNSASSSYDIYAQKFDANGSRVGGEMRVTDGPDEEFWPDVAADSQGNFTIVWEEYMPLGDSDIRGRQFDRNGTPGGYLSLGRGSQNQGLPTVAFNEMDDCLVTWGEDRGPDWDIYARAIVHPYWPEGSLATGIQAPAGFWAWERLSFNFSLEDYRDNSIEPEFSTDGGFCWTAVPADGNLSAAGRTAELRLRFIFRTQSNLTSPRLSDLTVSWVLNRLPVMTLPTGFSTYRNSPVNISVNVTDPDNDTLSISWAQTAGIPAEFSGNGTPGLSFTPNRSGIYSFRITASDGYGESSTSVYVTVSNRRPVVNPPSSLFGWKNDQFVLEANASDADGDNLTVSWTQTAGKYSYFSNRSGPSVTLNALRAGLFTFSVLANDGEDDGAPALVNLTVWSRPPQARLTADTASTRVGIPVLFDASASTDPDGSIAAARFSFGDGSDSGWIPGSTASHPYAAPGNYSASVTVRDEDGNESTSVPLAIAVAEPLLLPGIKIAYPVENGTVPVHSVRVDFTVENFAVANGSKHIHFQLDDRPEVMWYSLSPFTFTGVSDGRHTVRASLEDESHRRLPGPGASAVVNFTVRPSGLPDLGLSAPDFLFTPSSPNEGDTVTLSATVRNSGDADAGAFSVRFILDGRTLGDRSVLSLARGGNIACQVSWNATAGSHKMVVTVDPGNGIDELDEGNNEASYDFTVAPAPGKEGPGGPPAALLGALVLVAALAAAGAVLLRRKGRKALPAPESDEGD